MRCAPAAPPTGLLLFSLLLTGPAPTRALPQPLPEATEGAAISGLVSTTPAAQEPGVAVPGQSVLISGGGGGGGEEDLSSPRGRESDSFDLEVELELAELRALRVRLSRLADEVDARAQRLGRVAGLEAAEAAAAAPAAAPAPALVDCDGPACVARTVLRKAGYAVSAVRLGDGDGDDDDDNNDPEPRGRPETVGPDGGGGGSGRGEGTGTEPPTLLRWPLGLLLVVIMGCVAAAGCLRNRAVTRRRRRAPPSLPFHEPEVPYQPPRRFQGSPPTWWRPQRVPERQITSADEQRPVEKGGGPWHCCLDDWEEEDDLGKEKGGDEKRRCLDEGSDRYMDEPSVTEVAEHNSGAVVEEVDYELEEEEEEELLTLGEEIALFRSALELVEGMVAAQEERLRRV
ncbi:hypothetical protein MYCTH_2299295 [Thermothelomyces thermophilus ATCC 42464]|uniref:Uncharacterized protein n=1 Tax=Thermothelomyces thermophilus (strain ATCC 42464 / BCRC 31852 / DSM 1799) TaxID=573729 RepID=G2Q5A6_THET4|nr:uncharacterized protein MYCTH_2299295 [Thermothelomyces thermophilus ATCC 42464]AEO55446.1 hypothetical protein MYCTH_2299295 [Thermothelomyces thermophilus ATCC 42464]